MPPADKAPEQSAVQTVRMLIAEPWDFSGPWGKNRLSGEIVAVGPDERGETLWAVDLGQRITIGEHSGRFCLLAARARGGLPADASRPPGFRVSGAMIPDDVKEVRAEELADLVRRAKSAFIASFE